MDARVREIALACSGGQPSVDVRELPVLLAYVEQFLDREWLGVELDAFSSWVQDNSDPILQMRLLHRPLGANFLLAAIWSARQFLWICGRDGWFEPAFGPKYLATVAATLA